MSTLSYFFYHFVHFLDLPKSKLALYLAGDKVMLGWDSSSEDRTADEVLIIGNVIEVLM